MGDLVGQVLTHIIAFLAFLWVLKTFAWGPVMNVLEERRGKIQSEFDRIDQMQKDVEQLKEEYRTKHEQIEQEARELRLQEVNRGRQIADKMQEDARAAIAEQRIQLEQQLAVELAKAKTELRDFIVDLAIDSSSKLLHQSMDSDAHRRLIDGYIRQVSERNN